MKNRGQVWFPAAVLYLLDLLVSPDRTACFDFGLGPHWRCLLLLSL